jgi:transcriptional regulator with XRE-family HTH domain
MDRCLLLTKRDDTIGNAFGSRFGLLVRSYRDDLGISTRELAIRVWNDESRKASISRLENGRVERPSAKTIQLIAHALDIPQDEIDELRLPAKKAEIDLSQQLQTISQNSRDQLEALANRFEITRVYDRTYDELRDLLELKAKEYRSFRKQIDLLDGRQKEILSARIAANEAAERMAFKEADQHLRTADRLQTLLAVETREVRASQALLRGRVSEAVRIFSSAADALKDVDDLEMARRREKYHVQLFEHGLRYGDDGLREAITMQRPAVETLQGFGNNDEWASSATRLANTLAYLGNRTDGEEGGDLLNEAVAIYERVLDYWKKAANIDKYAMLQQNIGGALCLIVDRDDSRIDQESVLRRAIAALQESLQVRCKESQPTNWAMSLQNLAVAKKKLGSRLEDEGGLSLLIQSVHDLQEALTIRTRSEHPFDWALTRENLALSQFALARHPLSSNPKEYASAAIESIEFALEVYSEEATPYYSEKADRFRRTVAAYLSKLREA